MRSARSARAAVLLSLALWGCVTDVLDPNSILLQPTLERDFGTVPVLNSRLEKIPLVNLSLVEATITEVLVNSPDGAFRLVKAPDRLVGGGTVEFEVSFTPEAERDYAATLTYKTNSTRDPEVRVQLTAKGSTRAVMVVDPERLDFGDVGECTRNNLAVVRITNRGTAPLIVQELAFTQGSDPGFQFVGSSTVPATVPARDEVTGLEGELELTIGFRAEKGRMGMVEGGLRIRGTDPDRREVVVPLRATILRAPVAAIGMLGNGAPGLVMDLDGSGSSDPDGQLPLTYAWSLRSRPLASTSEIAEPDQVRTSIRLDPAVLGTYEVQLEVTDAQGVRSCEPAVTRIVAQGSEKLRVELFWENTGTDLDLQVLRTPQSAPGVAPDAVYYQNRSPDWGVQGDAADDPLLERDALRGFGPEVFSYVNPIEGTFRVVVDFANTLLSPRPESPATLRVYQFGVLKAEFKRTLVAQGERWEVCDIKWPDGTVTQVP